MELRIEIKDRNINVLCPLIQPLQVPGEFPLVRLLGSSKGIWRIHTLGSLKGPFIKGFCPTTLVHLKHCQGVSNRVPSRV